MDMSRVETTGQEQVARAENPSCLAMNKTGETSIVEWDLAPHVTFPPQEYHRSRCSNPP